MLISSLELSSSSRKALGFPACRFLQVLLPVSFLRVFSQEFTGRSSSRCLIFKVHLVDFRQPFGFRLRSLVSQALDYLTTFVSVCQVLFSTFFAPLSLHFFRAKRFNILPHSLWFVKRFFRLFPFRFALPFEQALEHFTTSLLVCQVLFSFFSAQLLASHPALSSA